MSLIDLYIGDAIEHGSDRVTLEHAVECLQATNTPAVVFANINVSGRQIDLAVATERMVLVIEDKNYTTAVSGALNGDWQVQTNSGRWKRIPNLYLQAVNAKFALRDAMRAFSGEEPPYPAAALVFVPGIPAGSSLPGGDYKASISGLDALAGLLRGGSDQHWPLVRWRSFALHLGLQPVTSVQAAVDPKVFEAERMLHAYGAAFQEFYGPFASEMVAISCRYGDDLTECKSNDAIRRAAADNGIRAPLAARRPCSVTTWPSRLWIGAACRL